MENVVNNIIELIKSWNVRQFECDKSVSSAETVALQIIGDNYADLGSDISMSAISEQMSIAKPAVTQLVAKLEKKHLVKRYMGKQDRRSVLVRLTEKGKALYDKKKNDMYDVFTKFVTEMGESDAAELIILVNKAGNVLDKIMTDKKMEDAV